jgi:hypothetical protein
VPQLGAQLEDSLRANAVSPPASSPPQPPPQPPQQQPQHPPQLQLPPLSVVGSGGMGGGGGGDGGGGGSGDSGEGSEMVLGLIDPTALTTLHPADLGRLAAVAEQNLLEVRAALKRRARRVPSGRPVSGGAFPPSRPASSSSHLAGYGGMATRERRGCNSSGSGAPSHLAAHADSPTLAEPLAFAVDGRAIRQSAPPSRGVL